MLITNKNLTVLISNSMRYLFILIGFLINTCLGGVYSWSVFRKPLEDALAIGAKDSGLPYAIFLAFFSFTMPLGGYLTEKIGVKFTVILGAILLGTGWFLASFSSSILFLVLTYGVIGGLGVGLVYGVPLSVIAKWFPDKKGFAIGLTLAGFGASPFFIAPLASSLIAENNVFYAFQILGITFGIAIALLALFLRNPMTSEIANYLNTSNLSQKSDKQYESSEMVKTPMFWMLWFCFFVGSFVGLAFIGMTKPIGKEIFALQDVAITLSISVFGIFNSIGRPLFGNITDQFGIKKAVLISYTFITFASLLILFFSSNVFVFYIAASIFWLNLGAWLAIAPTATIILFGASNYSKNYGFIFTAYGIGAVLGVYTSGIIKDIFQNYLVFFYPVLVLLAIATVLVLRFKK